MTDLLLQIGVSNLCVSLVFAMAAWVVQATGKRPFIAHLLWLLVLLKLVTPPLLTIPLVAVPGLSPTTAQSPADPSGPGPMAIPAAGLNGGPAALQDTASTGAASLPTATASSFFAGGKTGLALIWLLGTACVLAWSLVRIYRFDRLLAMATAVAPPELQRVASQIARRLGLATTPTIYTTSAQLSPMVWWIGGPVRVIIPAALPSAMDAGQLRWILAHELAHVRRRDHLVRWLEWLACVGFWWNPVAWWARRNLRANEEICCDALVLESLKPKPSTYANSLLTAVEFLASPALRPPAMASEINSGGFLERRFKMIVSSHPTPKTPRWLHAFILLFALGLLPLGVAYAQSPDFDAVGKRLRAAVQAGELTPEQARTMLGALRKETGAEKVGKRLTAAIEAGELTGEQARAMLGALRKASGGQEKPDGRAIALRKRLGVGVASGRITPKEAGEIFDQRIAGKDQDPKRERGGERRRITKEDFARIADELKKAVAEGKISGEVARKRLGGLRERVAAARRRDEARNDQDPGAERAREYLTKVRAELGEAVRAGKISREDAAKRYKSAEERIKKRMAGARRRDEARKDEDPGAKRAKEYLMKVRKDLDEAVEAGEISREDAAKRYRGAEERVKERMAEARRRDETRKDKEPDLDRAKAYLMEVKKELGEAIKAGNISPEDAGKRYAALEREVKKKMAVGRRRDEARKDEDSDAERATAYLMKVRTELDEAVSAGKISREAARIRYEAAAKEMEKKMAAGRRQQEGAREDRRKAEYSTIEARIRAAVKAGEMSEEDAERRLEATRKRMFDNEGSLKTRRDRN